MNQSRKYQKALKIGDYHYYKKDNYIKAIYNYQRCLKTREDNDTIYLLLSICYKYLGKLDLALLFINKGLFYSPGNYDIIKFKGEVLKGLGKEKEANICLDKINILDEERKNSKLDLDKFYNEK